MRTLHQTTTDRLILPCQQPSNECRKLAAISSEGRCKATEHMTQSVLQVWQPLTNLNQYKIFFIGIVTVYSPISYSASAPLLPYSLELDVPTSTHKHNPHSWQLHPDNHQCGQQWQCHKAILFSPLPFQSSLLYTHVVCLALAPLICACILICTSLVPLCQLLCAYVLLAIKITLWIQPCVSSDCTG